MRVKSVATTMFVSTFCIHFLVVFICVWYIIDMVFKYSESSRSKQRSSARLLRGVYGSSEDDLFDAYLARYPSAVVTLRTALSIHGIIDEWLMPPFDLCFAKGYRYIPDERIAQIRDDNELRLLGAVTMEKDGIAFLCHDPERLLIELWRREKRIPLETLSKAIFWYREKANSGELNLPKLRDYISKMPKSHIYFTRLRKEIL